MEGIALSRSAIELAAPRLHTAMSGFGRILEDLNRVGIRYVLSCEECCTACGSLNPV